MIFQSASRIAADIRNRKLQSIDIVEAYLERIEAVNPSINAVVHLASERARTEAVEMDKLILQDRIIGPLHGVPITLKDSLDTAGLTSTGGTLGRQHFIPECDASVVARLRAAGAVILGKTNTPELTLSGETNNLIYGRTSNPFDLSRSPGGSSGGSAAILAAGGSALDLGSDTGGSIREPAHLCGICGIKPTSGRTPRTGHVVPFGGGVLDSLTQIGPMARYIDDLILSLPLICGPDGIDPSVVPVPFANPDEVNPKSLRIGWYCDNGWQPVDAEIQNKVELVAKELEHDGFQIRQTSLPDMDRLIQLVTELREAANPGLIFRLLKKYGTDKPGPDLQQYLSNPRSAEQDTVSTGLIEAIDCSKSRALQIFREYDVILCPPSRNLAREHGASLSDSFEDWSYTTIHNLLGWPGLSVPVGLVRDTDLPIGVQLIGAPWQEHVILALGREIEKRFGGFIKPEL